MTKIRAKIIEFKDEGRYSSTNHQSLKELINWLTRCADNVIIKMDINKIYTIDKRSLNIIIWKLNRTLKD